MDEAAIAAATAGTFLGDYRVRGQKRACDAWPRESNTARTAVGPVAAPALVMSGELDPVTPPEFGAKVAAAFTRVRHVVAPNTGHDFAHPCLQRIVEEFVESVDPNRVDASCAASIVLPPFRALGTRQ